MPSLHRHVLPSSLSFILLAAVSGCNCQDRIRLVNTYGEEPELAQGGEPYNALNADAGMGHCDDLDGDGYGVGNGCLGPDCDDRDSTLGVDGQRLCYTGPGETKNVGACHAGTQSCTNGVLSGCLGEVVPQAETCDSTDNNCDGQVDEQVTRSCYSGPEPTEGVGACAAGTQTCVGGVFGACTGETVPSAEVCDGVDNDCDGQADDAVVRSCYTGPESTDGVGVCSRGTQTCSAGVFGPCDKQTLPSDEQCDGLDNDCDGRVDENVARVCYTGPSGTAGVGACIAGVETCNAGSFGACVGERTPASESCDNVDNDCDGLVDEEVTRSCYTGTSGTKNLGVCGSGIQTCSAGAFGSCAGETTPSAEICDNLDNDCDGLVDEDVTRACYSGPAGTENVGVCEGGVQTCTAGVFGSCVGETTPGTETCDNKDNDCDGSVDEALIRSCYSGPAGTENVGTCVAGSQSCSAGSYGSCLGQTLPATEACDGVDNDCDGNVDEAVTRSCYSGPPGTAGVGSCRSGTQSCSDGVFGACENEALPSVESCDNADNDCDGAVDDAVTRACYSGPSGTLGVGACQAGVETCSAGAFGACIGERTPTAERCDSADNDCDGQVDEAVTRACYSGPSNTEGVGICAAGTQVCSGGAFGACSNERTPVAETCDGADNNCNGQLDENQTRFTVDGSKQAVNTSRRPVDIIFVIDNSERMNDDIIAVERNINKNFAAILDAAKVDYRVIMLSKHGSASNDDSICISAPLSGTQSCTPPFMACPKNGPRFFHYSEEIGRHDSLYRIIATYNASDGCGLAPGGWSQWLRTTANKVFIEITKDGPLVGNTNHPDRQTADSFEQKLFALSATMFGTPELRNYIFHSIVGVDENVNRYEPWLPTDPLVTQTCVGTGNVSVTNGMEYQKLSVRSGGMRYPVCDHNIMDSILRDLAEGLIVDSEMACDFSVSPLPSEPNATLEFIPSNGGARIPMTRVPDASACSGDSFYLTGNKVTLCPQACTRWREDQTAQVEVIFSCQ